MPTTRHSEYWQSTPDADSVPAHKPAVPDWRVWVLVLTSAVLMCVLLVALVIVL